MKVELREDSVLISGYVNAVERYSKPIFENLNGKLTQFVERVKSGTFKRALERNNNVLVLLNHDYNRKLASSGDGTAQLTEDNIGLRAEVTITDAEVMQKAKEGKLSGWSFGMKVNSDKLGTENEMVSRTIDDLDLIEVSVLDDTKRPAYNGTSIEKRESGESGEIEIREFKEEQEKEEQEEQKEEQVDYEKLATLLAEKVVEMLSKKETQEQDEKKKQDDNSEKEKEKREIDYSEFENRLNKI